MIKAFAYGHDDLVTAKNLVDEGCEHFGVALLEEGVRLRENGITADILVFHPLHDAAGACETLEHKLTPVLSSWHELEIISEAARSAIDIHVKFNTGMNRLGFEMEECDRLKTVFASNDKLRLRGVCTHLLNAEDWLAPQAYTQKQIEKFLTVKKKFNSAGEKIHFHALNSAGLIANFCSGSALELGARPGISLYGVKPKIEGLTAAQKEKFDEITFKPVMAVKSEIILTHVLERGERVSYGGHFVAGKKSLIGVVPIGYADGYFRHFSQKGFMLCDGQRVPVAGTVCMDFTMVDLTAVAASADRGVDWLGKKVTVLGDDLQVTELAQMIGTNSYEILTNVSRRVPRVFV